VTTVQKQLNKKGFGPLAVDGDFGALTESAVKEL
jgi:peptidoglycan hydrolase-like protein with peptidoglycan-binding domain